MLLYYENELTSSISSREEIGHPSSILNRLKDYDLFQGFYEENDFP